MKKNNIFILALFCSNIVCGQVGINTENPQAIPNRGQQITYNGLMRPNSIVENDYTASFTYDQDGQRIKFNLKRNNVEQLTRYYIGGQYEVESGLTGNKEKLYLGGDFYSASSVYVKENNVCNLYHICSDYLGGITHIFTILL